MVRRNEPGRLRARVCPALPLGAIAPRSTAVRRGCSGSGLNGSGATPAKWGLHCRDSHQEWDARWRSTPTLGQGDYQVAAGSWVSCAWPPKSSSTSYPCPTRSADPRSPSGRCGRSPRWKTLPTRRPSSRSSSGSAHFEFEQRALRHRLRISLAQAASIGRAPGPLSPSTMTQWMPERLRAPNGPSSGSKDRNLTAAGALSQVVRSRHAFMEDVAHAVNENHARLLPRERHLK